MKVLNVNSLLSMPSIIQALEFACDPSALKLEAPRGLKVLAPERFSPAWPGVIPGARYTSVAKFRPFSGSSLIAISSMTVPASEESVRTTGALATTVVASLIVPTSSATSTRTRSVTCRMMPGRIQVLNPWSSTCTS